MSERKNIKRNANRVKAKDRAFHSSMQHNYNRKEKLPELNMSFNDILQ